MTVEVDSWRLVFCSKKSFASEAEPSLIIDGILDRLFQRLKERDTRKVSRNGGRVRFGTFDYPTFLFRRTLNSLVNGFVVVETQREKITVLARLPVSATFYFSLLSLGLAMYLYVRGGESLVPVFLAVYSLVILADLGYLLMMFDAGLSSAIEATREELEPPPMSRQQKEWMSNPNLCPACGSVLLPSSSQCPDCGLTIG